MSVSMLSLAGHALTNEPMTNGIVNFRTYLKSCVKKLLFLTDLVWQGLFHKQPCDWAIHPFPPYLYNIINHINIVLVLIFETNFFAELCQMTWSYADHLTISGSSADSVDQSLDKITANIKWRTEYYEEAFGWVTDLTSGTSRIYNNPFFLVLPAIITYMLVL